MLPYFLSYKSYMYSLQWVHDEKCLNNGPAPGNYVGKWWLTGLLLQWDKSNNWNDRVKM
jgi:hypothetical protein